MPTALCYSTPKLYPTPWTPSSLPFFEQIYFIGFFLKWYLFLSLFWGIFFVIFQYFFSVNLYFNVILLFYILFEYNTYWILVFLGRFFYLLHFLQCFYWRLGLKIATPFNCYIQRLEIFYIIKIIYVVNCSSWFQIQKKKICWA